MLLEKFLQSLGEAQIVSYFKANFSAQSQSILKCFLIMKRVYSESVRHHTRYGCQGGRKLSASLDRQKNIPFAFDKLMFFFNNVIDPSLRFLWLKMARKFIQF